MNFSIFLKSSVLCFLFASYLTVSAEGQGSGPADLADTWPSPGVKGLSQAALILPDGRMLVGSSFSSSSIEVLNLDGSLDTNYISPVRGQFERFAIGCRGKVYVQGSFEGFPLFDEKIVRLNSDLTLDSSFDINQTNTFEGFVGGMVPDFDDGIFLLGALSSTRVPAEFEARPVFKLDSTGKVDPLYQAEVLGNASEGVILPDGKLLVRGSFSQPQGSIVRLLPDGRLDASFNVPTEAITSMVVDSSGAIYGVSNGESPQTLLIRRFAADGHLDASFNVVVSLSGSSRAPRASLSLERNDQLLVAGRFNELAGISRFNLARLNSDGTVDETFDPGISIGDPTSIFSRSSFFSQALQTPLGQIFAIGNFQTYQNSLVRCQR